MSALEISHAALELPVEERLELARRLVESVGEPAVLADALAIGVRRLEDVATGRTAGLTESELRALLP